MRVIARLDIKNNFVIKGINLEGLRKVGSPLEMIKNYYNDGIDEIIISDSVASLYGRNNLFSLIKEITKDTFIPITLGGGIRSLEDIERALNSGADKVSINSKALEDPDFITKFSSQQQNILILAAYFCRSGRVDESSHKSQNPDNYYSRSANIFEAYVKQVIPQDVQGKADLVWGKKLIENSCKPSAIWSLNMSKTPGSLDCVGYDLITLAHELDLMRCFGKEFKNKTLPSIQSRAQKLALDPNKYLEKAINLCQITGSRIESDLTVNGQKIKRNFDMRKFSKNSLSGRDCWRTCLQIK